MNRFPCLVLLLFFAKIHAAPFGYVSDSGNNVVTVFDLTTNAVTASISVNGAEPLVVTPDNSAVYVGNSGAQYVYVISAASNTITTTITLPVGATPSAMAITADGKTVYVTDVSLGNVYAISTATNTVTATISVGGFPSSIVITPDGSKAYVGNFTQLDVISLSSNSLTGMISGFGSVTALAVTPDGAFLYVADGGGQIKVVSTTSDTLTGATIPVSASSIAAALLGSSTGMYAGVGFSSLDVINTTSNTVVNTISGFDFPHAIASTGVLVYVVNQSNGTVSVVSTSSQSIVATITVSASPNSIALGSVPPSGMIGAKQVAGQNVTQLNSQINTSANTIAQGGGTPIPVNGPVPQGVIPSITGSGNYSGIPNVNMGVFRGNCY